MKELRILSIELAGLVGRTVTHATFHVSTGGGVGAADARRRGRARCGPRGGGRPRPAVARGGSLAARAPALPRRRARRALANAHALRQRVLCQPHGTPSRCRRARRLHLETGLAGFIGYMSNAIV